MAVVVRRFDVCLVSLDPTVGSEMQKSRPCLIISPDEMNRHIQTVIIAPITTRGRKYPTRIAWEVQRKHGQIVLDQIRTVDKARLLRKLGRIDNQTQIAVSSVLQEMFNP
jgi:mRNA interferase MazF